MVPSIVHVEALTDIYIRQNPAFGTAQIRSLTEVFLLKSVEVILLKFILMFIYSTVRLKLRDVWARKIGDDAKSARIDVLDWLSKMTLDVIGQAGKFVPRLLGKV
jgi:hypothetical protein